jgi:heme/copper-type cytochrome/quinol oxidase subunit 2
MPFFNWNAASMADIPSDRFWLYWAVTAPLTAVVVGIVTAFAVYQSQQSKAAAEEARKSTLGWMPKSDPKG